MVVVDREQVSRAIFYFFHIAIMISEGERAKNTRRKRRENERTGDERERERKRKKSHIPAATGLFPYKAQQPVSSSGPIESMLQVFNKKKGNRNEVIKQIPTRNVAFRWR